MTRLGRIMSFHNYWFVCLTLQLCLFNVFAYGERCYRNLFLPYWSLIERLFGQLSTLNMGMLAGACIFLYGCLILDWGVCCALSGRFAARYHKVSVACSKG